MLKITDILSHLLIQGKKYIFLLVLLLCANLGYSQSQEERLDIYFVQDSYKINPTLQDNRRNLEKLQHLLDNVKNDSLSNVSKIHIHSWTSPEPGVAYNRTLSLNRSNAIKEYILDRWDIPDTMLVANGEGIAWDKLRVLVEKSDMQYRDEVLNILDNVPEETWRKANPKALWPTLVDSRLKRLMDLRGGRPYKYMYENLFPDLRYGSQIVLYYGAPIESKLAQVVRKPTPEIQYIPIDEYYRKPVMAVKTNLLYDIVTAVNIEFEIPVKEKYSIVGEWNFPWWVTSDNGNALEVLAGSVELRYWVGARKKLPTMTGLFYGLYVGGGLYDLQYRNNGYQGEFFVAAGFSLGYAHTINKSGSLRMEYSLGIGYLETNYRYYEGMLDNKYLVWQYDGEYIWFGPTKAKMALAWMLYKNKRKGGKR